ncbi:MAG TPA: hypothetical protein VLF88_02270 [Candidatus Babeliales bacterium]|nr:hypothetical protein [Candidatus Babeliales bacterium]
MAQKKTSIKHIQIDKSQTSILIVIALATAVTIFCLFGTKALISKGLYQRRALHARREAVDQLKSNYESAKKLFNQYKVFADADPNVLGGSKSGSANNDGNNSRIVLDSLPSKYDAPALATSLEKIMTMQNVTISSLNITDDPAGNSDQAQASPQPKVIAFSFAAGTNLNGAVQLLQKFEQSIRPFDIYNIQISGSDNAMTLTAQANTYFQPAKNLDLSATKEVK